MVGGNTMDNRSLYDEIAEMLAQSHLESPGWPEDEAADGGTVGQAIAAFVLTQTNALEAVILRLAREIDDLRNS